MSASFVCVGAAPLLPDATIMTLIDTKFTDCVAPKP